MTMPPSYGSSQTGTMPPSYGSALIFGDNHDAVHCRKTIPPSSSSRETASIHSIPSETTHTRPVVCTTRNRGTKELTQPQEKEKTMPPSYGSSPMQWRCRRRTDRKRGRRCCRHADRAPSRQGPRITPRYRCVEAVVSRAWLTSAGLVLTDPPQGVRLRWRATHTHTLFVTNRPPPLYERGGTAKRVTHYRE